MKTVVTLTVLHSAYMQDLFYFCSSSAIPPNNLLVVRTNTDTYGMKNLKSLEPQIWNFSPEHTKAETSLAHFQSLITT